MNRLMTGLALYTALAGASLPLIGVRLCVDVGLLAIVVVSLPMRRPFMLAYARQQVDPQHWHSPQFLRTNTIITAGWAVAFAAIVITDAALLLNPAIALASGLVVLVVTMVGASTFTAWYATRARHVSSAEADVPTRVSGGEVWPDHGAGCAVAGRRTCCCLAKQRRQAGASSTTPRRGQPRCCGAFRPPQ